MNNRINKDEYYLNIALDVAKRSTCLRKCYGAVIVNNDEIISTGYNGAPRGFNNCVDCGVCLRNELNIKSGENYELCRSVHAEANAIISSSRKDMIGSTLYLSGLDYDTGRELNVSYPCKMCQRLILNSGISKIIYKNDSQIIVEKVQSFNDDYIISKRDVISIIKLLFLKHILKKELDKSDEVVINYIYSMVDEIYPDGDPLFYSTSPDENLTYLMTIDNKFIKNNISKIINMYYSKCKEDENYLELQNFIKRVMESETYKSIYEFNKASSNYCDLFNVLSSHNFKLTASYLFDVDIDKASSIYLELTEEKNDYINDTHLIKMSLLNAKGLEIPTFLEMYDMISDIDKKELIENE